MTWISRGLHLVTDETIRKQDLLDLIMALLNYYCFLSTAVTTADKEKQINPAQINKIDKINKP